MPGLFLYQVHAATSAADRDTLEALISAAVGEDCTGSFSVPLGPPGGPASHYGCSMAARQSDLDASLPAAPPGNPEGRVFFLGPVEVYDPPDTVTLDVGDPLPEGWAADDPRLRRTWDRALADWGLQDLR